MNLIERIASKESLMSEIFVAYELLIFLFLFLIHSHVSRLLVSVFFSFGLSRKSSLNEEKATYPIYRETERVSESVSGIHKYSFFFCYKKKRNSPFIYI